MRTWLAPIVLAAVLLWVWWLRRTVRDDYLHRLVAASRGDAGRARTLTLVWHSAVVLAGLVLIGAAVLTDRADGPTGVRIALLLLVIAVVVPLGSIAGGRDETRSPTRRVQVRRSAQQRLAEAGADPQVAAVVVATSRPFGYVSFLLGVAAALLLVAHA
ncbi:hypothetical protein ACMYYO_13525 [Dermacoccaceae bacterium W4C1]